ncbi:3-deoxy-D-manno-octulosonate 8-phosphate phosphatase, partial [hydrothermal vent metagenome]
MEKSYKEIMPQITTFIFDIDGVLTNGVVTIFPNGEMVRNMNIKDGYAMKAAITAGYNICIISGGTNEAVRKRFEVLGITNVYLGANNKL